MKWLLTFSCALLLSLPFAAVAGDGEDCLRRGEQNLSAGDYRRALRSFTDAARLMPDSAEAWRGIGLSRFRIGAGETMTDPGMLTEAASAFNTALLLRPGYAEVRYQLGLTYLALENRTKAEEEREALAKLDPKLADRLLAAIGGYRDAPSFREVGTEGEEGDSLTKVTISGNHVIVPASIGYGEREVQARLVLDTGAAFTTISPAVAARLGITAERTGKGVAQVVGGALIETGTVKIGRLTVGPCTRSGLDIHIVPHNGPPVDFDGLLGMDFLRGLTYRIDFQRGLVYWGK